MIMRTVYSYIRLTLAAWLFLGGIALQFVPSVGAVGRADRRRELEVKAVPVEQRSDWIQARDLENASAEAAYRLAGVIIGGIGFAIAMFETAYVCSRMSRHCPLDTA